MEAAPISAPLIQSTVPAFGYGAYPQFAMPQMAIMPYPVTAQAGSYQLPEAQKQRENCDDQLRRLEDDVRQLTRDVDRIVDVVDRHSRVLDRLTEVLSADSEFMKRIEGANAAASPAPAAEDELPAPAAPSAESSRGRSTYRLTR